MLQSLRKLQRPRTHAFLVLVAALAAGCSRPNAPTEVRPQPAPPAVLSGFPATEADIRFMRGMIPHHEQALLMAGWAETHGASPAVRLLAERLLVSQRDEIDLIRDWLRAAGATVPAADSAHAAMAHGVDHEALMPGMLTEAELQRLDAARGADFDRLFLEFMIRHHRGAVEMVDRLFASAGAAQNEEIFQFANDVFADQTAEIDRMTRMLEAMAGEP